MHPRMSCAIVAMILVTAYAARPAEADLPPSKAREQRDVSREVLKVKVTAATRGNAERGEKPNITYAVIVTEIIRSTSGAKIGDKLSVKAYVRNPQSRDAPESNQLNLERLPVDWAGIFFLSNTDTGKTLEIAVDGISYLRDDDFLHTKMKDTSDSLGALTDQAATGDARAQLTLAVRYRDGRGVKQDYAQAMRWGHLAADQGHTAAMDFIGWMYFRGLGVTRNPEIAAGYFKASSSQCAAGAWNLGQCYFAAQGVDHDVPRALKAWEQGALLGHGRAASTAAMVYLSGEGVKADRNRARELAERAVELNDPSGFVLLGELHFQAGELDKARELWSKIAQTSRTEPTAQPEQPSDQLAAQQGADLLKLLEYRNHTAAAGKKYVVLPIEHVHQGWNNCGATSCAIFARSQGNQTGGWDFKKLCPSPLGTGTDWADLVNASGKLGLSWKLITFTPDDDGFAKATAFARSELDAGRPLVIDFKYIGPQYPGGEAGHTLTLVGYLAQDDIYVLCNPAIPTPGLQLISATDLKKYWRSDHYSRTSNNILSRPAIVLDVPRR